jgi:hypothetical protein
LATGQIRNCISITHVNISAGDSKGQTKLHIHDIADQFVLICRRVLVRLGAVIDFQEKYTIYKSIDQNTIIHSLERNKMIIFSLPLTGDLLKGYQNYKKLFVSFSIFFPWEHGEIG